ncbi:integral membrane protein [Anseongella ginsenosidimutans]|uniref:Integral membrane protein n=1 Tax=Anseongella ginsenosidimutans TaxID=496056 RepID=A0A4R3KLJ3_9SPHI|nr:DUF3817 domain-containing protein [Anseongella ginsenosidimutans]QEC53809.1 DUF3817 domain-containing protein [Anseongella ginsenosidimutans]TCS84953.1 integral membrane protein [Anseongella ginsenosidimutans]
MIHLLKNNIGRLRIIGFLEGISLLVLVFIAVPLKYGWNEASLVKMIGPVHGLLFLLFVFTTLGVGIEKNWSRPVTWKVLIACMIPFGTFYIDRTILKKMQEKRPG